MRAARSTMQENASGQSPVLLHLGKYFFPVRGGMETFLRCFLEATRGHLRNVCIVAIKEGKSRVAEEEGVVFHRLRQWGSFSNTPFLPTQPFVLTQLRRATAFDAIVLHYPNPMAVLALFLSLLVCPKREKIVVWNHADVLLEERWKRALYTLIRPVEAWLFRRADAFLAATPHHTSCSDTFRRFADRTTLVPYAIPDSWFEVSDGEMKAAGEARESLGGRFLLFVGRLVQYKGLDILVRAAERIPCRIAIIGTGPLEDKLRREIGARGLSDRVRLLGEVDDLRPYFLGAEFLVLPSVSTIEGFGIVQIESMALGKPVVCSDLPSGVTFVNRHGETGLTFRVSDADALARACNQLLSDEGLRKRLGENARRRTLELYSYRAMTGEAVRFFEGLRGGPFP